MRTWRRDHVAQDLPPATTLRQSGRRKASRATANTTAERATTTAGHKQKHRGTSTPSQRTQPPCGHCGGPELRDTRRDKGEHPDSSQEERQRREGDQPQQQKPAAAAEAERRKERRPQESTRPQHKQPAVAAAVVHPADKTDQQKEQRPGNKPREDRRRPGSTHPRLTKQRGPADTAALHPQRGTHHPRHKAPTRGHKPQQQGRATETKPCAHHSNYSATPAGLRATANYPLSITTPPAAAGRHPQGDPSPSTPFHPLPKPHNNTEHPTPAYT